MVAFTFILSMYALAGNAMYGADLAEFRDFPASMQACFALMLGGDNFGRMVEVTRSGTFVFCKPPSDLSAQLLLCHLCWTDWSWVLLGLLILMNLILSILVEGHIKARELIYDQDDLPTMKEKLAEQLLPNISPRLFQNTP